MPIPNSNFGASLFLIELGLQCQLFNRGIAALEEAAEHWQAVEAGIDDGKTVPPLKIVADCTVCLSSLAAIRRILYPNQQASASTKSRATSMLLLLGNPALSNVCAVKVRNSWEHFDERLDEMLKVRASTGGAVEQLRVSARAQDNSSIVLRCFDPVSFSIRLIGETILLRPCIEEIHDLSERIQNGYHRLQAEEFRV